MRAKKISQNPGRIPAVAGSRPTSPPRFGALHLRRKTFQGWGRTPLVVGTIHSPGSLRRALRASKGAVDFFELRVDHFADSPELLLRAAPRLCSPIIVTVRHHREGGAGRLNWARRAELFARFLPVADLIDVELRSVEKLADTLFAARNGGVRVIVSDHYFHSTPSRARLLETIHRGEAAGADIVKIAALASTCGDLGRLLALFDRPRTVPLSVMGIGAMGKVSRLLLGVAGSVLNYGYLHQPQVPGQWEATLLKRRIAEFP
jgi:3-dehydroquinate dehydratase-1